VTLWEILTLARDKPFHTMSNEMVIQNAERMYYGGELEVSCSKFIYVVNYFNALLFIIFYNMILFVCVYF